MTCFISLLARGRGSYSVPQENPHPTLPGKEEGVLRYSAEGSQRVQLTAFACSKPSTNQDNLPSWYLSGEVSEGTPCCDLVDKPSYIWGLRRLKPSQFAEMEVRGSSLHTTQKTRVKMLKPSPRLAGISAQLNKIRYDVNWAPPPIPPKALTTLDMAAVAGKASARCHQLQGERERRKRTNIYSVNNLCKITYRKGTKSDTS